MRQQTNSRGLLRARARAAIEAEKRISEAKLSIAKQRADKVEEEKNQLAESLNLKINSLTSRLEKALAEKDEHIASQQRALSEAENRIAELSKGLNRATNIAEELRNKSYAEERTAGHPQRKSILESVARGRLKSRAEINKLAEDLEPIAEEAGGVSERVRRNMSRGREALRETERVEQEVINDEITPIAEIIPGLEGVDVSVEEVLNLARIEPKEPKAPQKSKKK